MSDEKMGFGSQEDWERFNQDFPIFVQKYQSIEDLRDKVFQRKGTGDKLQRVVFGLGRVCAEDFQQALLLCGNGFGIGALQLVRGMYERQVTAAYLVLHPDKVDDFLDYHFVQLHKGLVHLKQVYKAEELVKIIPIERQQEVEKDFEAVKARFTETTCGTCKKSRIMASWSGHGMPVLAAKAGRGLGEEYFYNYFRPTMFAHSTVSSLIARLKDAEGAALFDSDGQKRRVKEALVYLHLLILHVLDLQNEFFKLGFDDDLKSLENDYKECWKGFTPSSEAS